MSDKEQNKLGMAEIATGGAVATAVVAGRTLMVGELLLSEKGLKNVKKILSTKEGDVQKGAGILEGAFGGRLRQGNNISNGAMLEAIEKDAKLYQSASLLKKPVVVFNGLRTRTKVGTIITASALGVGASVLTHMYKASKQSHAEKIEQERTLASQQQQSI
ncbi:MAG: hypothetical protein ACN2B6_03400 [Rickettsiales bacterium]